MSDSKQTNNSLVSLRPTNYETHIEKFFKEKWNSLASYAMGYVHNYEKALDAVSEAQFRVLRAAHSDLIKTWEEAGFSAYVYRIVQNLCIDVHRKQSGNELAEEYITDEGSVEQEDSDKQTYISPEIEAALERIPEENRLPVILCDIEEMPAIEAAETLGISVPALKSRLYRGRAKLAQLLHAYQEGRTKERVKEPPKPKVVLPGENQRYNHIIVRLLLDAAVKVPPTANRTYLEMKLREGFEQHQMTSFDRRRFHIALREVYKPHGSKRIVYEIGRFNNLTGQSKDWDISELEQRLREREEEIESLQPKRPTHHNGKIPGIHIKKKTLIKPSGTIWSSSHVWFHIWENPFTGCKDLAEFIFVTNKDVTDQEKLYQTLSKGFRDGDIDEYHFYLCIEAVENKMVGKFPPRDIEAVIATLKMSFGRPVYDPE